ncbi:uncharacterized protein LOC112599117 [Melanaphis sacchari]|uniref:uncharacterized protein LOC112599117 n=1 Tax=Melanaphis sacchari TaxID=742174 RepID=UPI000DC12D9F|nr:uncharacterized protein LOC112599117 [Melanaphis sacchari]
MIGNYIDREFIRVDSPPKTNEEMLVFIKNLQNDRITTNPDLNFVNQLEVLATRQLSEQWAQRWSEEQQEEENSSEFVRTRFGQLCAVSSMVYSASIYRISTNEARS